MRSFVAGSLLVPSVDACFGSSSACQVSGPASPADQPAWLKDLKNDRATTQEAIGWKGGVSDQVPWTLTSYIQPQIHPYDRYLYDPVKHEYTVDRFLEDLRTRYGGIDSLLLWPVYTQIGVDDRNQFDMFRSMPGGLEGVANLTAQFHGAGVKVLWPYKPWDVGTRREPVSEAETFATLLKQTAGDGLNGDTLGWVPEEFWTESVKAGHPLAIEPEGGGQDNALNWTTMGWGYWSYPEAPVVDRFKFVTEGKFLTNVCDRWAKDKTDNLQSAWFNGDGYESWENVWGTWNGITPYDGEAIRRVGTMLRYLGNEGFLQSPEWEPHTREVYQEGIYASKFPLSDRNSTVWTIVNRNSKDMTVNLTVWGRKTYYDCYHGKQLLAAPASAESSATLDGPQVSFPMEAGGYGCVFETDEAPSSSLTSFLTTMSIIAEKPLASYDHVWKYLPQQLVDIPRTANATAAPTGTVYVPREENFLFVVKGVEIEGDDAHGVDVQYPWEEHPQREHSHILAVGPFYMDKFPVTNANYSAYLQATGYRPNDDYRWLKSWNGSGTPAAEIEDMPVTYVGLEEARAYCAWKGARLPHSFEWQYAAQGTDGRTYPWGNDKNQRYYPDETTGTTFLGSELVTAHAPIGDSVFGVSDLVGNVWQYTDEFQDDHTRAVILRGGSNYRPTGSNWYFPQSKELNTHEKYFLFDDRYERAGTVGFRCIVDAACPEGGVSDCVALCPSLSAASAEDYTDCVIGCAAGCRCSLSLCIALCPLPPAASSEDLTACVTDCGARCGSSVLV